MASTTHVLPTVAVVEDDAPLCRAICFSLEAEGYPVRAFCSAEDMLAAEKLDEVGCFVIDEKLPKLNGLSAVEELQRRGIAGSTVLITTRPSPAVREACWNLGIPIVEKPLLGESLNACIRGLLAKPADA